MGRIGLFLAISLLFVCSGCHKNEETIDNVPVKDIKVSEPPEYTPPENDVIELENGVYPADPELTYYGAVVPKGAIEISRSDEETRFYVKRMSSLDAMRFVEKFFPYQKKEYYSAVDVIEVYRAMDPKYETDSIVPDLDLRIVKPNPEEAVAITVYQNKREGWYEWIYRNPHYEIPNLEPPQEDNEPDKPVDPSMVR